MACKTQGVCGICECSLGTKVVAKNIDRLVVSLVWWAWRFPVVESSEDSNTGVDGGEIVVEVVGVGLTAIESKLDIDSSSDSISIQILSISDVISIIIGSWSDIGGKYDIDVGLIVGGDVSSIEADDGIAYLEQNVIVDSWDIQCVVSLIENGGIDAEDTVEGGYLHFEGDGKGPFVKVEFMEG